MSALLSAGTPIEKCLVLLSKQSSNSKFSQILLSINEDITEGNSLSSSMKKYPSIFDEIYTSTIYAGETSASLSEVFFDLSIYLDIHIGMIDIYIYYILYIKVIKTVRRRVTKYIHFYLLFKMYQLFIARNTIGIYVL